MKIYYDPWLKKLARGLRNNSTQEEIMLWNEIKDRRLRGYQFMRQKPIEKYIVDFFCSKLKLIIEIDGESHIGKEEYDRERQNDLESLGLAVLCFDDIEVRYNLESVFKTLENWIDQFESAAK